MWSRLARLIAAVSAGILLDVSRPELSLWGFAFVAAALCFYSVYNVSLRFAALSGISCAVAFWFLHLHWLTNYLGIVPWVALAGFMALWFMVFQMLAAVLLRGLRPKLLQFVGAPKANKQGYKNSRFFKSLGSGFLLSFCYCGLWLLRELLESSWPYGGFAWGRFAASFADAPFAGAVSIFGVAAFGALMLSLGIFPIAAGLIAKDANIAYIRETSDNYLQVKAANTQKFLPVVATFCSFMVLLTLCFVQPVTSDKTIRIAAVQGNAKAGIFDNRENGDVIASHLQATKDFITAAQQGHKNMPDIFLWPENAAEFGINDNLRNFNAIQRLAAQTGASFTVGSVLQETSAKSHNNTQTADINTQHTATYYNSALTITPAGEITARYDKRNPVPFGEFMPNREFFRLFAPDLVDLVQLEYQRGATATTHDIAGVKAGIAICFDITFDRQTTAMLQEQAEIFLVLTNNADFGKSDESWQQLALTKLQALSSGRALVNVSTVGQSQILDADGKTLAAVPAHTAGVAVADVPLYSHTTVATRWGAYFAAAWIAVAVFVLIYAIFAGADLRRTRFPIALRKRPAKANLQHSKSFAT